MEGQNNSTMPGAKNGSSLIIWVVLIIVIVVAAFFVFSQGSSVEAPEIGGEDTTSAIGDQLDSIDIGEIENELQGIDGDLNQL